jgi:tetratricopeptide (TPR) repeat protein
VAPDFVFAHQYLAHIYLKTGRPYETLEEWVLADKSLSPQAKYDGADAERRRGALESFRRDGLIGYMRWAVSDTRKDKLNIHDPNAQYELAFNHAALGNREQAFQWLEKAVASRAFVAPFFRADPVFDELRSDPRYQALLRRAGLEPQF